MDDDASIHDRLLWAIHMSGFDDLVQFLASAQSEQQWSLHILEIITLMFRDQVRLSLLEGGRFSAGLRLKLFVSFLADSGDLGECWPVPLSRGEAEGLSGTGVTEAEGAGGETLSHIPERDKVRSHEWFAQCSCRKHMHTDKTQAC